VLDITLEGGAVYTVVVTQASLNLSNNDLVSGVWDCNWPRSQLCQDQWFRVFISTRTWWEGASV